MEFRLLGPVEVRSVRGLVDAGPPRQRTVLAALAVDAGRAVLVDTVLSRVWGDDPPDRARHALYVYVARLRRVLETEPGVARIVRRSRGYLLDVDPDRVDTCRFARLLERAGHESCRDPERAALLRQALALWQGTPLADLQSGWAARVRETLRRQRLGAAASWAQAELRLGNVGDAVGPLTGIVAEHPLAESLVGLLMRCLHATGCTAEALDLYARTRRRLVGELGADPSAELQELHRTLLRENLKGLSLASQAVEQVEYSGRT
jgi:DNA-binding SARP family transcriptional activator